MLCCNMPASDELTRASMLLNHAHLLIADPLERRRRRQRRALAWRQDASDAQMVRDADNLGIAGRNCQPRQSDEMAKPTAAQTNAVSIKDGGRLSCSG
jgi:hypothetical protein